MFTINVRRNGPYKNVVIENFVIGELDLGLLTDTECKELANNFRNAAKILEEAVNEKESS